MTSKTWAGNKARQQEITKQIVKRFRADHPIDLAGACETILSNLINDTALSYESALAGVDAVAEDMRDTIRRARTH